MNFRKMAVSIGAGAMMLGGGLLTSAHAAPAPESTASDRSAVAGGCWVSGGKWWCNNVSGAGVYKGGAYPPVRIGTMYSNPSWFYCRAEGGATGGGGPHSNRWIKTVADNGALGWMKDSDIYSETNPLPVC